MPETGPDWTGVLWIMLAAELLEEKKERASADGNTATKRFQDQDLFRLMCLDPRRRGSSLCTTVPFKIKDMNLVSSALTSRTAARPTNVHVLIQSVTFWLLGQTQTDR